MKKLTENRPAAIAILVLVALLAVPLLGGLRLAGDYHAAARTFSKAVASPDRHGNDIFSDTDQVVIAAESLLTEGRKLSGDSTAAKERADRLRKAIDDVTGAKDAAERYINYEALVSEAKQYYNVLRSSSSESFDVFMTDINSLTSRIERVYRPAYTEFTQKREKLVSGFPAAQLARLYGIGGGK